MHPKPQLMILKSDVVNPKPDKRMTRSFRGQTVWKAGAYFVKEANTIAPLGEYSHNGFGPEDEYKRLDLLLAACEPAPESFTSVMVEIDGGSNAMDSSNEILRALVRMGKITLEDLRLPDWAWRARPEEEQ